MLPSKNRICDSFPEKTLARSGFETTYEIYYNKEEQIMQEIQSVEVYQPAWAMGRSLDELAFCDEYLLLHPVVYVQGQFYGEEGRREESLVRKEVFDYLSTYYTSGLAKKVNAVLEALKMRAAKPELETPADGIFCANGVYHILGGRFSEEMTICRHRLPVAFDRMAPEPVLWKSFLRDLLEPEDILTLQEYLGYCLMPANYAQKMLLIIGRGGEGKSRIGVVLHHLLGEAMCNGSLAKLEASPFARADLQHRLVMVDDDLRLEALKNTNYIKSLITAEQPLDLERKGQQSYQGTVNCRFIAFGNGNLRSLHDRSMGFFRRQIILTTKDRPADRVDDPLLAQRLRQELPGILLWCIEGLHRLLEQNFRFTLSHRTRKNILAAIAEGDNTQDFFRSEGYFRRDPEAEITTRALYQIYRDWCEDNLAVPLCSKTFVSCVIQNADRYGIVYSNKIHGGNGRMVRGFRGLRRVG